METLPSLLDNWLGSETMILLMVLVSTICVVSAIFFVITGSQRSLQKRLDTLAPQEFSQEKKNSNFKKKVEAASPFLVPSNEKEREGTRLKLIRAGYHHESAISYFYAIKIGIMLLGLFGASLYYLYSGTEQNIFVLAAVGAGVGMFLPNAVLERMVTKRQKSIKRGVPDALDLLVVCTESGLGLNMALNRVSKEISISHPDLAEELEIVCAKIKAGYEMPLAFRDLVSRTGVLELTGLVSMLSHAAKLGGSIAQTLRDYTEDYRDKRNQELEEMAAKLPTKMMFPMIICIWPSFFIVVVGPALLGLFDAFKVLNS